MAGGSRASPHGRSCTGWPVGRRRAFLALQRSGHSSLRSPSSNAATLSTGPALRKAVNRLIPALSTVAFD
eukprot:14330375-Alexandrium_andersonii.AAC.1